MITFLNADADPTQWVWLGAEPPVPENWSLVRAIRVLKDSGSRWPSKGRISKLAALLESSRQAGEGMGADLAWLWLPDLKGDAGPVAILAAVPPVEATVESLQMLFADFEPVDPAACDVLTTDLGRAIRFARTAPDIPPPHAPVRRVSYLWSLPEFSSSLLLYAASPRIEMMWRSVEPALEVLARSIEVAGNATPRTS